LIAVNGDFVLVLVFDKDNKDNDFELEFDVFINRVLLFEIVSFDLTFLIFDVFRLLVLLSD